MDGERCAWGRVCTSGCIKEIYIWGVRLMCAWGGGKVRTLFMCRRRVNVCVWEESKVECMCEHVFV